eukprot:m.67428 g.67428  ORF g.67428 m.67428 type:complete len:179 (-) comp18196_c0_seq1:339-875(-)
MPGSSGGGGARRRDVTNPRVSGQSGSTTAATSGQPPRFDDNGSSDSVQSQFEKEKKKSRIDLGVLFWLFLAIFVTHYFDVVDAVLYDPRVDRDRLFFAEVLILFSIVVTGYAIIVVEVMLGKDYLKHSPWAVPLATVTSLIGWVMFWMCMWPVWGFVSFLIIPSLFMGLLLGITLIPL